MPNVLQPILRFIYDWLSLEDSLDEADLVFALAGRESRKAYALLLFSQGKGKRLLLSVGRYEIRRFAVLPWPAPLNLPEAVAGVPPPIRHSFVTFGEGGSAIQLIKPGSLGTWSEIGALAEWLKSRQRVHNILIISSGSHLRRVRLCCRALLPKAVNYKVRAVVEDGPFLCRDFWWRDPKSRAIVLAEFPKLLLYWTLLQIQRLSPKPAVSVI